MQYIEITYKIMNNVADTDGKSLLVPLLNLCLKVFFCPNMVVLATDNTASTTGCLTCIEHNVGETSLLGTVLDKAMTELLSPGLVRYAHCLNFLAMVWVQLLLLMHDY
jgi:hypothetical protein